MKRLPQIICEEFDVPEEEILQARNLVQEKGGRLGDVLISKKIITERQLQQVLSLQYDIPFQEHLDLENLNTDFADTVPIQFLKRHLIVPLKYDVSGEVDDAKGQHVEREPPQRAPPSPP